MGCPGHVEDVCSVGNALGYIHLTGDNGGDYRDIHYILDLGNGFISDRGVDHHAEGALMLSVGSQTHAAPAIGNAAAYTNKHRHVRYVDNGLGNAGLGGEGVDGDNGVAVDVFDDGHIGRKHQGLNPPAEDPDTGAFSDALGDLYKMAAQGAAIRWYDLLHGCLLSCKSRNPAGGTMRSGPDPALFLRQSIPNFRPALKLQTDVIDEETVNYVNKMLRRQHG